MLRDWAQTAEGLGYSHILAFDHVLGAVHEGRQPKLLGPYTERDAFHELFVLFGYFAACTSRIELTTGVLVLPQRQTALVAKQAAQLDLLSGGRLRLGDGFIFGGSRRRNLEALATVYTAVQQAGRSPDAFGIEAVLTYQAGRERWREQVLAWIDAGADYVAMGAMAQPGRGNGLESPQAHLDALQEYWRVVGDLAD